MKQSFSAVKWFVLALVCAGITSHTLADTAKVIQLKGAARYSTGNNQWVTLREGDILKPGSVIQTASDSTVDIVIGAEGETAAPSPVVRSYSSGASADTAQNIVRLRENTVLALDKLFSEQTGADVVTDYQLDLRAGRILGNVKKLSAASRYEIKIPNGVAGIRGTTFDLSVAGILKVFFGSVTISFYDTNNVLQTVTVNAGFQLDYTTGSKTPIPAGTTPPPMATTDGPTITRIRQDGTTVTITPVLGDNTPPQGRP
jgi:hypothetical protein